MVLWCWSTFRSISRFTLWELCYGGSICTLLLSQRSRCLAERKQRFEECSYLAIQVAHRHLTSCHHPRFEPVLCAYAGGHYHDAGCRCPGPFGGNSSPVPGPELQLCTKRHPAAANRPTMS